MAWDKICLPKSAGGLNVRNLELWNKAAILRLLWALSHKADKLWVQWIHIYYIKGRDLQYCNFKNLSWMLRKILNTAAIVDKFHGWLGWLVMQRQLSD